MKKIRWHADREKKEAALKRAKVRGEHAFYSVYQINASVDVTAHTVSMRQAREEARKQQKILEQQRLEQVCVCVCVRACACASVSVRVYGP